MEQIYYTQCPVGYGLGASNGFQVKRLSRGYPTSGDFRHLGLRAFPGGSRTLAPPALRYRRDGDFAEIAWLTPRTNEYETERGLWGRPGGHFAHGLRLQVDELKAIKHWPAGLFDSSIWKRTDREPTRGRPPDELDFSVGGLFRPPTFADISTLAQSEVPERLARLLTALATVAREGRTLFLIDEPGRLGPIIALLTFAFPEKLRADLTFSTYHDRPEELPGLRISGTIPLARPNRPALTAQGIVADLVLGTFEPKIEAASWATTLAGWLTRGDPVDEADWSSTDVRARIARKSSGQESAWSDDWLGHLHAYPKALRSKAAPDDSTGWQALADFTGWLGRTGLAEEWVRPRNASWWLEAAGTSKSIPEARAALVAHATLRETWRGESRASNWGEVIAAWFRDQEPPERDDSIAKVLLAAPKASRPSFARSLLRGLTPSGAEAVLGRLRVDLSDDRAMLLPLEASAAMAAILGGADPGLLRSIVENARDLPGATVAVLEEVEESLVDQPEMIPSFAEMVSAAFDLEAAGEGREGLAWALRRGRLASVWLAPALRPILADTGRQELWLALRDRSPEDARSALARAVLAIATDPGLPDEAYRWGVESLLLPLAPRPSDPTWAETYLRRTPSGLDLLKRLVAKDSRKLGVMAWLDQARGRGEISAEQAARIDTSLEYARALNSRDPSALLKIHVPSVPLEERGQLLGQMLANVGGASLEGLPFVLEAAQHAWPGAFEAGAPGLRTLAVPLARCLANLALTPPSWLARVTRVIEQLGLTNGRLQGFEPDGLAAQIAASTPRIAGATADPWPLRKALFKDPNAWRILSADVVLDLGDQPIAKAVEVLTRWDSQLPMVQTEPGRFLELFLNSCDGPRLVRAALVKLPEFDSLPPIPWWGHQRLDGSRDDIRDGFTRIAPLAPLPIGIPFLEPTTRADLNEDGTTYKRMSDANMSSLKKWIEGTSRSAKSRDPQAPLSLEDEPEPSGQETGDRVRAFPHLSGVGLSRWRCLEALTSFKNAGWEPEARWPVVASWKSDLPLSDLSTDERHRFIAWLIFGLKAGDSFQIAPLAFWLKKSGIKDYKRLGAWPAEIEGLEEIPGETELHRSRIVNDLRSELFRLLREDQESSRKDRRS
jgi:GTPase-associated protein 1, middle domain